MASFTPFADNFSFIPFSVNGEFWRQCNDEKNNNNNNGEYFYIIITKNYTKYYLNLLYNNI